MSHIETDLLAYLDGELSPAEVQAVEAHLAGCPTCTASLNELRALESGLAKIVPAAYESVHLSSAAEARIRSALAAERAKSQRTGSFQQGLANLWAGLLGASRPLSKAAIPLMAVFFVVLAANATRMPMQAGVQQTVVLGQDTLTPGSQAAVRVVVRNGENNQPVANAKVAVALRQPGLAKTVYTGTTDDTGSTPVQFSVPADWQGDAELVVNAESDLGDDEVVAPIHLDRSYRLFLSSDKPVYQPGETIHLRTLALGQVDGLPAAGATARFEVVDPTGKTLLSQAQPSSEFGIASADLPLEAAVPFGQYQIRANLEDTISELSVQVGQAELPSYRVDVKADAPYYQPGNLMTGQVAANYFFGKPVAGAQVELRLVGNKLGADPAAGEDRLFVKDLRGETDDAGQMAFQFELPNLPAEAFGPDGTLQMALEATVTDATGDAEFGWQTLALAQQPILIDVVPEGGTLRTGVENIVYVLTSYPDGQPAPTSLQVQIGTGAPIETATSDFGLAEVRYTPRAGDAGARQVQVTATDAADHTGTTTVTLPLDESQQTLLLRTDRALYKVGETLALEAIATGGSDAVYVDVLKGGQTLLTQSALVKDGRATLGIDLTPDLAGTLELNAYQIAQDGSVLRDTRVAVVDAPEDLQVAISTDKPEYRPGEEAQVSVETTRNGQGVEAGVGLSVVNEAVYAQREYQPGFARTYFILDQALKDAGVSLPNAAQANAVNAPGQDQIRTAQQQTAKASWASYQGQAYTLTAGSVDTASKVAVNAERQAAFSRLSVGLSLALILLPLLLAVIVLAGLRGSGVLGRAASRLLLTLILLAVGGAVLLVATQQILALLSGQAGLAALIGITVVWMAALLALLVYGWRRKDQRAQYVALLMGAYAVLLALLAYAAAQGATLGPVWLALLAGGFGVLLAVVLLFGWGLRLEGEKRAGTVALLVALLLMPLVVALNAVDLAGTGVIQQVAGPVVYGLNRGWLTGCAAPAQPQVAVEEAVETPAAAPETAAAPQEAPAPGEPVMQAQPAVEPPPADAAAESAPAAEVQQPVETTEVMAAPPSAEATATAAPAVPAVEAPSDTTTAQGTAAVPETAVAQPEMMAAMAITTTPTVAEPLTTTLQLTAALAAPATSTFGVTTALTAELAAIPPALEPIAPPTLPPGESSQSQAAGAAPTATPTPTAGLAALEVQPATKQASTSTVSSEAQALQAAPTDTPTTVGSPGPAGEAAQQAAAPTAATATATPEIAALQALPPASPTGAPTPALTPVPAAVSTPAPTDTPLAAPSNTPTPEPLPTETPTPEPTAAPAPAVQTLAQAAGPALTPTPVPLEALPIIRERFPQTLYWNPEIVSAPDGRLQVQVPTGDTITTWRVTALAVDRSGRLGSASAPLVVFQPLFLEPDLPADLSVGDDQYAQVLIFNYGAQPMNVTLAAESTPGLAVQVSDLPISVPANDVAVASVRLQALSAGPQAVTFIAQSDGQVQDARQAIVVVK